MAPMTTTPARINEFGQPVGEAVTWGGAAPVEPVRLAGATCTLEPLERRHAPELLAALEAAAGNEQWTYMPPEPCHDVAAMEAVIDTLHGTADLVPFAILDASGVVQGMASLLRIAPGAGTVEVGWIMYGAGLRRAAGATEAIHLLARHVFDLGYRRFEWKCDALNAPSRAAAARLGFAYEGTFAHALVYKGRNRDTAWFAMTDGDWDHLRPGYEAWLADLDADGRQAGPLATYLTGAGGLRATPKSDAP